MKPFCESDWEVIGDIERCPYGPYEAERKEWLRADDRRMLLLALDRYADFLRKER